MTLFAVAANFLAENRWLEGARLHNAQPLRHSECSRKLFKDIIDKVEHMTTVVGEGDTVRFCSDCVESDKIAASSNSTSSDGNRAAICLCDTYCDLAKKLVSDAASEGCAEWHCERGWGGSFRCGETWERKDKSLTGENQTEGLKEEICRLQVAASTMGELGAM